MYGVTKNRIKVGIKDANIYNAIYIAVLFEN